MGIKVLGGLWTTIVDIISNFLFKNKYYPEQFTVEDHAVLEDLLFWLIKDWVHLSFCNTRAFTRKGWILHWVFTNLVWDSSILFSVFVNYSFLVRQIVPESGKNRQFGDRRPGSKGWFMVESHLGCNLEKLFSFWIKLNRYAARNSGAYL